MADAVPHTPPVGGPVPDTSSPGGGAPRPVTIPPVPVPPVAANDAVKIPPPPVAPPPATPPKTPAPPKNFIQGLKASILKPVTAVKQAIAQRVAEHNTKKKLFERGVHLAGFGGVLQAAKNPKNKTRAVLTAVGHKLADMVAGSLVSNSFRLIAITLVAAMIGGVSSWGAIGLLALATGVSSAVYTYGKGYLGDRFTGPKEKRADAKFFDRTRAISAGRAFLSGAANGAFGAWLAKLPLFQHVMHYVRNRIHASVGSVTPDFNSAAAPSPRGAAVPLSKLDAFGRSISAPFRAAARGLSAITHPAPKLKAHVPAFPSG